jgi:hypothetical protein
LTTEIDGLSTEVYWVNDAIAKREERKRLKASHKATDEIEKAIDQSLETAHIPGTAYDDLETQLELKKNAMTDKQQRKAAVDAELIRRADIVAPQQHFKLEMSLIFAVLVGFVMWAFSS